jgi:Holliday junction resolvasome RuvABC endonuclease subunit
MKFVTIDMSTKFLAYALWNDAKLVRYGKVFPNGTYDLAAASITAAVVETFKKDKIERVVYESAFLGKNVNVVKGLSKTTGAMLGGFYLLGVRDFQSVPPIVWQNGVGVGRTTKVKLDKLRKENPGRSVTWIKNRDRENRKQLVVDLVNQHYKLKLQYEDNDLADAIAIGYYELQKWTNDE